MIISSPLRNSYSSVLFVNGFIHLIMLFAFIPLYVHNQKPEYMYIVIVFSISSITLILSSVLNLQFLKRYNEI